MNAVASVAIGRHQARNPAGARPWRQHPDPGFSALDPSRWCLLYPRP
ncbi:hypothetical protein [Amycolatopsis sp. NPDC059021]